MTKQFLDFRLAKRLKEKGFTCKYPFAFYDEDGYFYPLFTSCDEDKDSKCIFGNRMCYDYDDFGDEAIIAPTIEQVMEWLRSQQIFIEIALSPEGYRYIIYKGVRCVDNFVGFYFDFDDFINLEINYETHKEAMLSAIYYILNNLIQL